MLLYIEREEEMLLYIERVRDERDHDHNDGIDRMRHQLNEMIESQQLALEDRDAEIQLLYRQMEKYEKIIDEAEHVTHEQRSALSANKKEISELSMAIEQVQNGGILGKLDTMCSSGSLFRSGKLLTDRDNSNRAR